MQPDQYAAKPAGTPATPEPPAGGDEAELEQKRKRRDEARDALAKAQQESQEAESDYQQANARITERRKMLEAYEKAAGKTKDDLDAAARKIEQELRMAEAAVKDQKDAIEGAVKDVDKAIDTAWSESRKAQEEHTKLWEDQKRLDAEAGQKENALADVKKGPANTEKQVKDVKALVEQADKAEGADDYAGMYFLLNEARSAASDIKIPTAAEYEQQLKTATQEAEDAAAAVAANRKKFEEAKAAAALKAKVLDALRGSRRADILKKLKELPRLAARRP
jgi:hypothetical protein